MSLLQNFARCHHNKYFHNVNQLRCCIVSKIRPNIPHHQHHNGTLLSSSTPTIQTLLFFSTTNSLTIDEEVDANDNNHTKQLFVQTVIKPGEWDHKKTNPLYRPKYRSNASIISAEDYKKRPTVSFTGEFDSYQDAMVTLSWLTQYDQERIYQLYIDLIQHSYEKYNKITSHEYVVRVIAQKFNITSERVAAIIQLQHNQEQIQQNGGTIYHEAAQYMDSAIQQEIDAAYATYRIQKPIDPFVEDPVGVNGGVPTRKSWSVVDDIFDVDTMLQDIRTRDDEKARVILDNHIYIEDVDDATVAVPVDRHCKKLIQQKEKLFQEQQQQQQAQQMLKSSSSSKTNTKKKKKKKNDTLSIEDIIKVSQPKWNELDGDGKKRQRYKYIAQIINTRQLKQEHHNQQQHKKASQQRRYGGYPNQSVHNTMVEHENIMVSGGSNSILRPATMDEIQYVSWKPKRHIQEFTYRTAKQGWLQRTLRNQVNAWGKTPVKRVMNPSSSETIAAMKKEDESAVVEEEDATVSSESNPNQEYDDNGKPPK